MSFLSDYPSLWPALLLVIFLPLVAVVARHQASAAYLIRKRARLLALLGMMVVGLFVTTALTYLHCASFWDLFESREASVAALLRRGGIVYPGIKAQERYCAPYGPAFYLILASSQAIFGASVWATKLPSLLASCTAVGLFWVIIRRQGASQASAWAWAGLEAALLMAFRQLPFWAKTDPLVLCASTAGLCTAFRSGWGWCMAGGICSGVAVDLKPHALAYFLPGLVVAFQTGWRTRQYAVWAAVTMLVAGLPFVVMRTQFSLENYLGFLWLTAKEGVGTRELLGFGRWVGLLTTLVFVLNRLTLHLHVPTREERSLRWAYRMALAAAVALVAMPACSVGAGQAHLIPLLPAFLLAAGDRFSKTPRVNWHPVAQPKWMALGGATVLTCVLIAFQTTGRMLDFHRGTDATARACAADARRLLARYARCTVLTGSGGDGDLDTIYQRHLPVFAGHPIGLDAAAVMDYQRGGTASPDLKSFDAEMCIRHERDLVWLLPRGAKPFTVSNIYDRQLQVYPPGFRQEFTEEFELREQSPYYDIYTPKLGRM